MTTAGIGSYWWNPSLASDRERANLPRQVTGMEGQRAVIMDAQHPVKAEAYWSTFGSPLG